MALFKFRKSAAKPTASPAPPPAESVEALRQRARRRLIGAAVLVALAVVGLPLLFDRQPRPIPVDLPIDIPDRDKVAPLQEPASAPLLVAASATASASAMAFAPASSAAVEPVPTPPTPAAAAVSAVPAASAAATKPVDLSEPLAGVSKPKSAVAPVKPAVAASKNVAKPVVTATAPDSAGSATGRRWVLQVGAYADEARVAEVRQRLKRAGLETYTQKVKTKEGNRTRVRVGPFADKAQAEGAAAAIRKLDLTVSLLAL